ncbi:MAG: four-helix bundle copper-binding protein [Methylophilales bacterium 28-44-11]|jgi:hypothetical protein|nr:MAG: four-helix bundle copper-binding protein [Methylophilales bacterium 28-44-11]OYY84492.1 MAG: four-helix bundle copper-binding protein [Methylophilales bacterium 16-45-9]
MAHEQNQSCINACNDCADHCDYCASACLNEGNVNEMVRCISLDIDCAAICRLAAGYMARDSEFAMELCQVCAIVCEACAEECDKHSAEHCKDCAEACRKCAEECRNMA